MKLRTGLLLRWLLIGALACGLGFGVRRLARVERPVTSWSMWPTLVDGYDHVTIDRLARSPQRFEIWALDDPLTGAAVVKRIVALPEECFALRDGDLWVGPTADRLQRARRKEATIERQAVEVYPGPRGAGRRRWEERGVLTWRAEGEGLSVIAGGAGGTLELCDGAEEPRKGVYDDHLDAQGRVSRGRHAVGDVTLHLQGCVRTPGALVVLRHRTGRARPVLELMISDAGAELALARGGRSRSRLWAGGPGVLDSRVELRRLDGRIRLRTAATDGPWRELLACEDPAPDRATTRSSRISLSVQAGRFEVRRLRIERDLHWHWWQGAQAGPISYRSQGGVFVLGDNPPVSRDGRDFGPLPTSALRGRVTAVRQP